MRIDPDERIAGFPILVIRDLMRKRVFGRGAVEQALKLDPDAAEKVLAELAAQNYICPFERPKAPQGGMWQTTPKGSQLANAGTLPAIERAEAGRIMADFMARVARVAESDEFHAEPAQVVLFGSYLGDAPQVNDIDLILFTRFKETFKTQSYDAALRAKLEQASRAGKSFADAREWLNHLQAEVLTFLRETSPYLSFHRTDVLKQIEDAARIEKKSGHSSGINHDTTHKIIYRAPPLKRGQT